MFCGSFLTVFLGVAIVRAQDRSTEQGEAQILDPNLECTPYSYPPVASAVSSFPPLWVVAQILPSDAVAQDKWNQIAPNVPAIPPRNITLDTGPSAAFATYDPTDPDCWWPYGQCTVPKHPNLAADVATIPEPNTLGYGFDDGPNCSHNAFYEYLTSKNQKATMFYIGSSVMIWPLEAQRALADGHEICVHTWSHRYMTSLASQDAFAELYYTMQAIKLVTGVTPTCWRPPMGDVDDRIRYIATSLGLSTIIWTRDSFDWEVGQIVNGALVTPETVDNNYQTLINDASSGKFASQGVIMLSHELNNYTMSEAVKYYDGLAGAFQHLVPVGVALNKTQPYVETNYHLPTFDQYIAGTKVETSGSPQTIGSTSTSSTVSGTSTVIEVVTTTANPDPQATKTQGSSATSLKTSWTILVLVTAFLFFTTS